MPDYSTRKQLLKDNYTSKGLIHADQLNRISRMLNNISGENGVKVVVNTSGIKIQGNDAAGTNEAHFQVENNSYSSSVTDFIIRGGYWIYRGMPIPTVTDAGHYTGNYDDDVYSLTVSNAAPKFIVANLDLAQEEVSFVTQANMASGQTSITVAWVNTASREINQYFTGDLWDNPENDHSWHFTQITNTSGSVTQGTCYLGGTEYAVNGYSDNITGVIVDTDYWLELHRDGSTFTTFYWKNGAAGTEPAPSDTLEIVPVLEFKTTGGIITGVIERLQSDYHDSLFG
jgi:hypothetical protein